MFTTGLSSATHHDVFAAVKRDTIVIASFGHPAGPPAMDNTTNDTNPVMSTR